MCVATCVPRRVARGKERKDRDKEEETKVARDGRRKGRGRRESDPRRVKRDEVPERHIIHRTR